MYQRQPAVAGMFYEGDRRRLREQVDACFAANDPVPAREQWIGAVVPHAGLMYSGHVAAAVFQRIEVPQRWIVLSPNHTGRGRAAAINERGEWLTPLGAMKIDEPLAMELAAECTSLEEDTVAHEREHSLEVQLPFIQTIAPDSTFVPICLARPSYAFCREIGEAIACVISRSRDEGAIGILASSDMNHYESQQVTLQKDQLAIDRVLALDPEGLWRTVHEQQISMCGILPTTAMLIAVRELGATSATLVKHATSGDASGDYAAVVGYAGIVIS